MSDGRCGESVADAVDRFLDGIKTKTTRNSYAETLAHIIASVGARAVAVLGPNDYAAVMGRWDGAATAPAPAAAPALTAGALRMARRRPLDHAMPVIDTPGGAVPTGPLVWAATGVDLALLGSMPALAALVRRPADVAPYVAGTAVLAAYVLSSGSRAATGA
ncbi:hypothetical protein [Microbispora sp. H11081]|uniref:hypothetical protein n=1 Tax=Microbispora sp. H11081 TaxID=2729107 RepID=UPI001473D0B7|nr:hypothetical protein [Microbispora sp. H11081]